MLPPRAGGLAIWEPSGLLVAFPVIVYGFTAHQVLFSIYSSLRSGSGVGSGGWFHVIKYENIETLNLMHRIPFCIYPPIISLRSGREPGN